MRLRGVRRRAEAWTVALRLGAQLFLACAWVAVLGASEVRAGNADDAIAGTDAALTGGSVVATVHTGAALWFNPAGVAQLDVRSVGLTGSLYSVSILKAPGLLSLENGEESQEKQLSFGAVPRALTFALALSPKIRLGFGFFFSRARSRLAQDTVISNDASPSAEWFWSDSREFSIYHVSSAVGWKLSETLSLGAAFDIVLSQYKQFSLLSGAYGGGEAGAASANVASSIAGGGLQLKAGVQWAPTDVVRTGLSVSMPSYMVYISDDTTSTQVAAPPNGPPSFEGTQVSDFSGAWAGAEPGNVRAGVAYVKPWGWLELDLIYDFPLESADFNINRKGIFNARLGGVIEVSKKIGVGFGIFTDRSPQRSLEAIGDRDIDFYGVNIGVDFANRDKPPAPDEKGFYLALALAVRYEHGHGQIAGVLFPSEPTVDGAVLNPVDAKINELGVNLAVKALF